MQHSGLEALLGFQVEKAISSLYKRQLEELENIRAEHLIAMARLKKVVPSQYHESIDIMGFLDDNTYALKRKRILDAGNEAIRSVESQLGKFDIKLKGLRN
jgi:hypothetical protein